jgi:hypothetical protein
MHPPNNRHPDPAPLLDRLAELLGADVIPTWLEAPNEAFGGVTPREVAERGEADRLWDMIFYLESGIPS